MAWNLRIRPSFRGSEYMSQVGTVDVRVPTQIAPIKFHLATAGAGPVSLYNAIIQLGHVAPLQIEQLVEACARVDPSWKTGMRPDTLYEAAHEVLSPQDFMLTLKEHATFDDLVPGALLWVSPLALVQNVLRPGSTAHGGLPDGHELVVGERVQGLYDSPCYKWRKAGDVGTVTRFDSNGCLYVRWDKHNKESEFNEADASCDPRLKLRRIKSHIVMVESVCSDSVVIINPDCKLTNEDRDFETGNGWGRMRVNRYDLPDIWQTDRTKQATVLVEDIDLLTIDGGQPPALKWFDTYGDRFEHKVLFYHDQVCVLFEDEDGDQTMIVGSTKLQQIQNHLPSGWLVKGSQNNFGAIVLYQYERERFFTWPQIAAKLQASLASSVITGADAETITSDYRHLFVFGGDVPDVHFEFWHKEALPSGAQEWQRAGDIRGLELNFITHKLRTQPVADDAEGWDYPLTDATMKEVRQWADLVGMPCSERRKRQRVSL
jgi:hypothetical protein